MYNQSATIDVIVVDDHEIVREGIATALNAQDGMQVVRQCGTAEECLVAIKDFATPVVIVLDVGMSGLCPFSTAEKISKLTPRNKVIFHSGHQTSELVQRAKDSGAAGYVVKSEPISVLVDTIRKAVADKKVFPEVQGVANAVAGDETVLSPRELEVLRYVAEGNTAKQIGEALDISTRTAERHKTNIMDKLKLHSQVELTRYAIRKGIIIP